MRIIFFGTSEFAVPVLEALVKGNYEIAIVITQPDKPTGRKQALSPPPVKVFAKQNNIKILQPKTLKNDEIFEIFKLLNPDICVVTAYGKIIPKRFLELPNYGFINVHPSLLPKYRGPSPIQTAILNGETETGVTIMAVDEEIDHGPILASEKFKVGNEKFYPEIEKGLAKLGAELLIKTLPKYTNGDIKPTKQNHEQATFTKMLSRENGRIDWHQSAEKTYNQIRALNPEPGTWTTWNDKVVNIPNITMFNIVSPQVGKSPELPGTVKKINENIVVATEKGYLALKIIQLEGNKRMPAKDFVNGHKNIINSVLK